MEERDQLPPCYTALFNAVTDALAALDRQDVFTARALLIQGQQRAEAAFLDGDEQDG